MNPAWHFCLSTRFSCCLKMKSVVNILGYIWGQFYRFSKDCRPQENLWNCSRKYPKLFDTYFIFRQKKIEFKTMSGVIMLLCNRMFYCIFGWFFGARLPVWAQTRNGSKPEVGPNQKSDLIRKWGQIIKKLFYCPALELFLLSAPTFLLSTPMENCEAILEKATKFNKYCFSYDTLTIYDGGSITSPMIGEYCDSIPPTIITTSNEVFIHFQTNAVFTESGFIMEYNATSN